jgi:hypothetical protein
VLVLTAIITFVFPESIVPLFWLNFWLFSYPHTFATFYRRDFHQKVSKSQIISVAAFWLAVIFGILYFLGNKSLLIFYFLFQMHHYFKQNLGSILKICKTTNKNVQSTFTEFYLSAAFMSGLIYVLTKFEIYGILEKSESIQTACLSSFCLLTLWFLLKILRPRRAHQKIEDRFKSKDGLIVQQTIIFGMVFFLAKNLLHILLLLGIGHNLQYILIVSRYNKTHPIHFWIAMWIISFIAISIIYLPTNIPTSYLSAGPAKIIKENGITLSYVLGLVVIFTHYTYDGHIWKSKFMEVSPNAKLKSSL